MGIAGRLKKERRQLRGTLKEVVAAPIFYFATESGGLVFREQNVSGRRMLVTYGFTSHGEAKTRADEYQAEWDEEVHVRSMPVGSFLSFLFHHLTQADIDLVISDGEKPYPLTTMGVNVLQDPLWAGLLERVREAPSKNVLLAKVARDLLTSCGGPGAMLPIQAAKYEEIVRVITGQKRAVLPTVDLGLVWFLTQPFEDDAGAVEPVMLKITGKADKDLHDGVDELGDTAIGEDGEVIVGPLCFSNREAALDWGRLLPPHIAVHLMDTPLMLTADRGTEYLAQVRDLFPAYRVDDLEPDAFVFDGGVLPLTLAGAGYVESKINYASMGFEEPPERNWLSVAQGKFTENDDGEKQCRNMAIGVVARELGIEIVDPEADAEEAQVESRLVSLQEDDAILETAINQFMKVEP